MARPVPNGILGIDVSHWQDVIDWEAVASSSSKWGPVKWAYAKATEGQTHRDKKFLINAVAAEKAGIPMGAYHWLRPGFNTPVGEAKNFVKFVQEARAAGAKLALRPMIDLEEQPSSSLKGNPQEIIDYVTEFAGYVEEELGQKCILYVGSNYAAQYLGRRKIPGLPVWIPAYNRPSGNYKATTTGPKVLNNTTEDWAVWQFSAKGELPGFKSGVEVDLNVLRGDAQAAIGLGGGGGLLAGGGGTVVKSSVVMTVFAVLVTLLALVFGVF